MTQIKDTPKWFKAQAKKPTGYDMFVCTRKGHGGQVIIHNGKHLIRMITQAEARAQYVIYVGDVVRDEYDLEDGNDLCFNFVELGRIDMADGISSAARIVAQNLEQQ